MNKKWIVVSGAVLSGIGKGVTAASIGLLMKLRGHSVQIIKFDPYLNINAGIINPNDHGEVVILEDGGECDLDMGHYERIAGLTVSSKNIYTSGTMYKEIITEQEEGKWLGQTIQQVPHCSKKIQKRLEDLSEDADIVIAEIGGSVGDAESFVFYEAIRQLKQKYGEDVINVLVAPILWVPTINEFKTKPLQNGVKDLQRYGLYPDMLFCRVDRVVPDKIIEKIADLTSISKHSIFQAPDVPTIYQVPIEFYTRHVDDFITDKLRLKRNPCRIYKYKELVEKYQSQDLPTINVGIFGKYDNCNEAYLSLKEAIYHAGLANDVRVNIVWQKAEELESYKDMRGLHKIFEDLDAIIVPGGFDNRGIEGKIKAIRYVREKKIPFLGICLGLQCAVIEFARNACGFEDANSFEFDKETQHPVVHYIPGQENLTKKSGTMRLGAYDCELVKDSLAFELYGKKMISERHRHRFEVNNKFIPDLEEKGLKVSGKNPEQDLVEVMELDKKHHPFFIGTQSHPEFKSRLLEAAPLFKGLIKAALENRKNKVVA